MSFLLVRIYIFCSVTLIYSIKYLFSDFIIYLSCNNLNFQDPSSITTFHLKIFFSVFQCQLLVPIFSQQYQCLKIFFAILYWNCFYPACCTRHNLKYSGMFFMSHPLDFSLIPGYSTLIGNDQIQSPTTASFTPAIPAWHGAYLPLFNCVLTGITGSHRAHF